MPAKLRAFILSLSLALVLLVIAGDLGVRASSPKEDVYSHLSVFSEVLSKIRTDYVEEPDFRLVNDGALHGLLESLDANSSYLSPAEYSQYKARKEGKAGVGATFSKRGLAAVISVIPGGPAEKAGIENGDYVDVIDNKSTRDMSLAEIRSLMTGAVGSYVKLSVVGRRKPEPQKITITRDVVRIPPATERILPGNIAYLNPHTMTKGKAQEMAAKIRNLQQSGYKKLVLDLRNVAEGELSEGISVANLFLNHGTITYLEGQKYPKATFTADPQKAVTSLPMVVLVNRNTAGAAEIVAAALMENARADVVGEKSFGVGSVQKLIEVPGGAAIILSIAKYYSPSGKPIPDAGVTPTVQVGSLEDEIDLSEDSASPSRRPVETKDILKSDEQLRRAVDLLKSRG